MAMSTFKEVRSGVYESPSPKRKVDANRVREIIEREPARPHRGRDGAMDQKGTPSTDSEPVLIRSANR